MPLSSDVSGPPWPGKLNFRPKCPVCGGPGQIAYRGLIDACFSAPGEWGFSKCWEDDCGVLWLSPAPAPEELSRAYREYHTHGKSEERRSSAVRRVYDLCVDALFYVTGVLSERQRVECMFLENREPGSLLDVGCGRGDFLAHMTQRGWSAIGVDFDSEAAEVARNANGVYVRVGGIECLDPETDAFDAITANHSIEHVVDPLEFLRCCRRLLKPGGRLVIRTPNADSFGHGRYRNAWRGLEPPRHLCVLTTRAIRRLASQSGLRVIECSTSPAMAEGILLASHFIRKFGHMNAVPGGVRGTVNKMLGPVLAVRAQLAWKTNNASGEEVCAVLCRSDDLTWSAG